MSKIVAGTAFVLLGGATVTGGALLLTNALGAVDVDIPKTLDKFKEKGHEEGCVQSLFPGLEENALQNAQQDTATQASSFFGTNKKTKACLVVNWKKDSKTENSSTKWKGNMRLLFSAKDVDSQKGIVLFLTGKTPDSGDTKEIQWNGRIYVMTLDSSSGKWQAKYRQEVASNKSFKKTGSTLTSDQFPHPGTALKDLGETPAAVSDYWGWFNANDIDNIYSTSTANDSITTTAFRGYWDWTGKEGGTDSSNASNLCDWTKEVDKWWKEVFDESTFPLKTITDNIKGTWTTKFYETTPASPTTAQNTTQ